MDQLVEAKQAWNTDEAADGQWASEPTVVTPWQAILLDSTGWIVGRGQLIVMRPYLGQAFCIRGAAIRGWSQAFSLFVVIYSTS